MSNVKSLESILKEVEEPRVEIFLDKKLQSFLKTYAKNRQAYNEKSFNKEELQMIKKILDHLFTTYIVKYEHASYKLSLFSKKILDEKERMDKTRKELQELGEDVFRSKWDAESAME